MEKKFVSVVVYLHNHENRLERFLKETVGCIRETFENYELICVDDACSDNTVINLKKLLADLCPGDTVTLVRMGTYQGLEASMNAGRDLSIGDFVFEFDTPFVNYSADLILQAYRSIENGSDLATVSPSNGISLSSRVFYGIFNHYNRGASSLCSETFRLVSRRAINRIKSISDYIPYRKAVYANCGLKNEIIHYTATETEKHKAEKNTYERVNLAFDSFVYFTNFLERMSSFICAFFLLFSVASAAYALWDHFVNGSVIEGWTSIICFMSFGFFGVFLLLTIILKYLSVILNLIFKRQKYLVSSIEKAGGNQ